MVRFSSGESGVLINEWWVLAQGDYDGIHEEVSARLGVDDLTGHSDGEQQIAVDMWINHEPYRRRNRGPAHDLALVRLAQPARLTPQVQPAPLPTQCAQAGELCVATSFASTSGSGKQQCLVQKMLSDSVCERLGPWWSPYMTCTGSHPSSGGHCMGVEGFGWMSDGCSHGKPDTYAKICKYRHWIDSVMSSVTPPPTTPPPPAPSESPFTLPPGFETTTTTPCYIDTDT
ncbi:trypsinogen-like protein 3 [Engraulis encrasicolus]|uniref:trypsinogen-like protein 3 n=1 Tax=Engraulis encrasicolus TaxID=184585 RepID=UPI002FD05420